MLNKLERALEVFCDSTGFIHYPEVIHGSLFCKLNSLEDYVQAKKALKGFFKFYNGDNITVKGYKLDDDNYTFDFI